MVQLRVAIVAPTNESQHLSSMGIKRHQCDLRIRNSVESWFFSPLILESKELDDLLIDVLRPAADAAVCNSGSSDV